MTTKYIPHILYTIALTSISTHLLWHRRESEDERRHVGAHISLLESTLARLRAGEKIPEEEFERIGKFGRNAEELEKERLAARGVMVGGEGKTIGWKEAMFGSQQRGGGEYDRKELEKVRKEIEEASS